MSDTTLTTERLAELRAKVAAMTPGREFSVVTVTDPMVCSGEPSYEIVADHGANTLSSWECNQAKANAEGYAALRNHANALLDAADEVAKLRAALGKVNDVRNSIIGSQQVNWSKHIYPLVAALSEAGIEGMEYPAAKERFATTLERITALEAENATLRTTLHNARVNPECGTGVGDKPACGSCVWCENARLRAERDRLKEANDMGSLGYRILAEARDEIAKQLDAALADNERMEIKGRALQAAVDDLIPADALVAARADDWQVSRLLAWLRDPQRKEPSQVFTSGVLREAADEVEMMLGRAIRGTSEGGAA